MVLIINDELNLSTRKRFKYLNISVAKLKSTQKLSKFKHFISTHDNEFIVYLEGKKQIAADTRLS